MSTVTSTALSIIETKSCQIVYTAIVGVVMLAALLEWFLWIAAFLYCLWKVFAKAEHWTVRLLAVLVGVAFTLLRYAYLAKGWNLVC